MSATADDDDTGHAVKSRYHSESFVYVNGFLFQEEEGAVSVNLYPLLAHLVMEKRLV